MRPAKPWTWDELAAETLRRQFPRVAGRGEDAVVNLIGRVGPIQSQVARATFLAVSARLPGATRSTVDAVHESMRLVRSSSLRGTIHTSTAHAHAALAVVGGAGLAALWRRTLGLDAVQLGAFHEWLERITQAGWTTHDEIVARMGEWLAERGWDVTREALTTEVGKTAYRCHVAMLRRPRRSDRWDGQAEPLYRASCWAIGEEPVEPEAGLVELVRRQIAVAGPLTRRDLAWWSGSGLRQVDAAVRALGDEIVTHPGPNGLDYLDIAETLPGLGADPGVRLLGDYDALLLAYEPNGRGRFGGAQARAVVGERSGGVHTAAVLAEGRLRGWWRLTRASGGATAVIDVAMFPGEKLLDPSDVADQAGAVGGVLGLDVTDVRMRVVNVGA